MADLTMKRGDSKSFRGIATVIGPVIEEPIDLTGATVFFTAKSEIDDEDINAIVAIESPTDIVIDDPETGVFYINIAPAMTEDLIIDGSITLVYDVQIVTSTGDVYTIDTGTLTVQQDITRRTS